MQALIKGEAVEIPITTVSIAPGDLDDMLMFHCTLCGDSISQYQGYVTKIYPFAEPSPDAFVLKRCRKCRQQYRFLTHRGYIPQAIRTIVMHNKMGINEFHCFEDRFLVARFTKDTLYDVKKNVALILPGSIFCPAPGCALEYNFVDLV